jgi:putative DNA primase/helicase
MGNAEMLAEVYRDDARYNHRTGRWIVWDDDRWKADTNGHIIAMAKVIPRLRYKMAADIENPELRQKAIDYARSCEGLYRLKAMIELAETEDPLSDNGDEWDRDPYLLGVANGVLDLRTAELRQDRREDRITIHTEIPFSPDAECPRWEQFLREIFIDDEELIAYIQRAIGYTLTGHFNEQYFHILFGEGQNGKSVFMNVLTHILGPYAFTVPFSVFEKTSRSGIPTDLAATAGKRLTIAAEVDESVTLNEARLKAMTGGDTQAARFPYRDTFNFKPTAKVWLIVNRKPVVTDDSHSLWRRVRLVPFLRRFEKADKQLESKLQREASGILLWAAVGCLLWQSEGLDAVPKAIQDATRSYRNDSDVIGQFLAQRCSLEIRYRVSATLLWDVFNKWRQEQGYQETRQRQFNASLESRGLHKGMHGEKRTMVWFGLDLTGVRGREG